MESLLNFSSLPFPQFSLSLIFLWATFWKGVALWRASQGRQMKWFVALLILNTAGILEIVYLFKFAKKTLTIGEIKSWLLRGK